MFEIWVQPVYLSTAVLVLMYSDKPNFLREIIDFAHKELTNVPLKSYEISDA